MQNFIITLLICSVVMSVLSLVYMSATPLLTKHYSEKGCYYAWLIIVVGLIIPFRLQWGNALVKVEVPSNVPTTVVQTNGEAPIGFLMPITLPPIENIVVADTTTSLNISWCQVSLAVWLAGLMLFIVYHGIKHYRFTKMARRWSKNITDEHVLSVLKNLKSEMGISKKIPIYLCPCVGSPMLIGIIKPQIFLPTAEMAQDELCFILKHELTHYKRKDLLYKYLILSATALHWFNPVVYLIAKEVNVLCETSCDTEVLQGADMDTRQFYGETIIGVAKYHSSLKTALSTTFYGGKIIMKKRISSIMDAQKKKAGVIIIALVLALTMGAGFVIAATPTQSNGSSDEGLESTQQVDSLALIQQNEDDNDIPELVQHDSRHFSGPGSMEKALEVDGLVGVVGVEQNFGWVYARELDMFWDIEVTSPEEAVAYMKMKNDYAQEHGNVRYVDVYDFDGETVIDKFMVEIISEVLYGNPSDAPNIRGLSE